MARWPNALAAAQRFAESLTADDQGARQQFIRTLQTDLDMLECLEEVRLRKTELKDDRFHRARADADYLAAFQAYGIDVSALSSAEAAEQIRHRLIAVELAAALDDWAMVRRWWLGEDAEWRLLLEVAQLADPDPWRIRFRNALRQRDPLKSLQQLADADVGNLPSLSLELLGKALYDAKDYQTGARILLQAQHRYPDDFWINHMLAWCYRGLQQWDEAARFHSIAASLRKDNAVAWTNLGDALERKGNFDRALAAYREAVRIKPDHVGAQMNLGVARVKKGKQINDHRMMEKGIAEIENAIRPGPDIVLVRNSLGHALLLKGDVDRALEVLNETIRLHPSSATAHYNRGIAYLRKGDHGKAIDSYRQSIHLDPNDPDPRNSLAALLVDTNHSNDMGQYDEAIVQLDRVLKVQPGYAVAHFNLGNALRGKAEAHFDAGKVLPCMVATAQAIAAYHQAIVLAPTDPRAHVNLGIVYKRLGRPHDAIAFLRQATFINRDLFEAQYSLGQTFLAIGAPRDAVAPLREAVRLKPDSFDAHFNLGAALLPSGETSEAIAATEEALRLKENHPLALANLGRAYHVKGDLDKALYSLRLARQLLPDDGKTRFFLGWALLDAGQFEEALEELQQAEKRGIKEPIRIQECERLLVLDHKLQAIQRKEAKSAGADESIELAGLCKKNYKQLYAAAAGFYSEAFTTNPELVENVKNAYRFNALCCAAVAGSGLGRDADGLEASRARWRKQALDWLDAELALRRKELASDPAQGRRVLEAMLQFWHRDPALAQLRDESALANLPEAEREACRKLWHEVARMLELTLSGK